MTALKTLIFDIESIPAYELTDAWIERRPRPDFSVEADPKAAEAAWIDNNMKLMSLQPEACKMVGLNVIVGDSEPKSGWVGETTPKGDVLDEAALLTWFWSWAAQCPRLVGFNCLRFDLHVIRVRSAMLGVAPTVDLFNIKPWEDRVIDLLARRFERVPKEQYLSLKALRRLLGFQVPEKYTEVLGNTGAGIEELYLRFVSGDAEALRLLKLYGESDVLVTKMLAERWQGYYFPRIS